jgi:diguanylate cyclase (GGDEF)-like protein
VDLRTTTARVMTLAQHEDPDAALTLARRALLVTEATPGQSDPAGLAGLWYAVAVAERVRGDAAGQLEAADHCLAHAREAGSRGWESNALSMRAMAHILDGAVEAALLDLARAEVALGECTDDGLCNWGHTGLGCAYIALRLYELALPHFQQAAAILADPVPLPESRVIDLLNLAETHLNWADELERAEPYEGSDDEAEQHRTAGHRHAAEALELARTTGPDALVASLQATVLASRPRTMAEVTVEELGAELSRTDHLDHHGGRAVLGAALARALWRVGRREEALVEAERAAELSEAASDWQVSATCRWLHVEMLAQADLPGAASGRAYGRLLSQVLWQQRLSTLQGAHAALDVERLKHATALAQRAAHEDPLTGIGNRRALDVALEELREHPDGPGASTSLVVVDLDEFKAVNDTHGHVIGDQVLRAVALALRHAARTDDLVARLGGDEFVVLARGTDQVDGRRLAERVDAALRRVEVGTPSGPLRLEASVGVATTGPRVGVPDLLAEADASMYGVKGARHRLTREPEGA